MGEKCIGESPWVKSIWVKSLRVKRTYIGQESLGEKFEKPVEEESLVYNKPKGVVSLHTLSVTIYKP